MSGKNLLSRRAKNLSPCMSRTESFLRNVSNLFCRSTVILSYLPNGRVYHPGGLVEGDGKTERVKNHKKAQGSRSLMLDPSKLDASEVRQHVIGIESDSDTPPNRKPKVAKGGGGGKRKCTRSIPSTACASDGSAAGFPGHAVASTFVLTSTPPSTPTRPTPSSGTIQASGSSVKEERAQTPQSVEKKVAGRPATPVDVLANQLWEAAKTAGEGSLFFGEKSGSQQRSLQRYSLVVGQKVVAERNPDTMKSWEMARKKLQVLESLIKIYLAWQRRKDNKASSCAFNQSWDAMVTFAAFSDESQDPLDVECPFMHDLRLQVMASGDHNKLVDLLKTPSLRHQFPAASESDIQSLQERYIGQAVTQCLVSSQSLTACRLSLSAIGTRIKQASDELAPAVAEDASSFFLLIEPLQQPCFSKESFDRFQQLCNKIPEQVPQDARGLLPLLASYPKHGSLLVKEAKETLDGMCASLAFRESVEAFIARIRAGGDSLQFSVDCHEFVTGIDQHYYSCWQTCCPDRYEVRHAIKLYG